MTTKKQHKRKEESVCCDEETQTCEPCEIRDDDFGEHGLDEEKD